MRLDSVVVLTTFPFEGWCGCLRLRWFYIWLLFFARLLVCTCLLEMAMILFFSILLSSSTSMCLTFMLIARLILMAHDDDAVVDLQLEGLENSCHLIAWDRLETPRHASHQQNATSLTHTLDGRSDPQARHLQHGKL
jgi:hypothetical protein